MLERDPKGLAATFARLRAAAEAAFETALGADEEAPRRLEPLRRWIDEWLSDEDAFQRPLDYLEGRHLAIQSACNQYVELFDQAPAFAVVMTRDAVMLDVNHAAASQFATERDELIGRSLALFLTPESQGRLQRQLQRATATGWRHACELSLRRTDGTSLELAAEVAVRPPRHPDGRATDGTVLLVGVDVTSRNRAERTLRENEARYRGFFEGCGDALLVVAESWSVVDSNPAACRLFGASARNLQRRSFWSVLAVDPAGDLRQRVLDEVAAPSPRPIHLTVVRADDSLVSVEAAIAADATENGRVYYIVLRDLTTRADTSEGPDGSWERLQRAQKLEALGRLAGGLAHDIGNVLTAVNGLASAVLGDLPEDSPMREDLEAILAANQRGGQITRQLLSFARRETPHSTALTPARVVREVADLAARGAAPGIVFDLELDDSLVIEGDAGQLSQVFLNLFMNALDAMPHGGSVRVRLLRVEGTSGDRVARVLVTDTGEGMDAETRERAFEPFFTTKPDGRGTGLGLAMVYRLVRNHGGTVDIDSAPNQGTTIIVDLPLSARAAESEPEVRIAPLHGAEILVVDDEALVLAAIRRMLRPVGCEIETALNGRQALSIYESDPSRFALVILDINMEGMDGVAVLEHLLTADPTVRVLITSGGSFERIPERHRRLPNVRFLRKPFGPKELSQTMAAMVAPPAE
jgi:PAS domain S-box-containing protein